MLAVKAGAVAIPDAPVATVTVVSPPGKVPLAPEAGAENVTAAFGTGLPDPSFAVAPSAVLNRPPMGACWGVPAVARIEAGGPARFVSAKLAGVVAPMTVALTL